MVTLVRKASMNEDIRNKNRSSMSRLQVLPNINSKIKPVQRSSSVMHSTNEHTVNNKPFFTSNDDEISFNRENIRFVVLESDSQFPSNINALFRAINDDVDIFTDTTSCLNLIRSSNDIIFFISSWINKQFIGEIHNLDAVEAIFLLSSEAHTDSRYPKLYGVYAHLEELIISIKDTLDWFEQTQMEQFVFEHSRRFLWSQLWKEEFIKPTKSRVSSNKEKLIRMAEYYYRGNIKLIQSTNEFAQSYTKSDALEWCVNAPFPARLISRALRSSNTEHLDLCRFVLSDASQMIKQQSKEQSSCMLYRGMKMTKNLLDKLENHIGELICPKGFFICTQSRKTALAIGSSPDHRPDLMSVLFKINYDTSVPIAKVNIKDTSSLMVFDIYTAFRVKYVNRGPVTVVKIEPAYEDGRSVALEYRSKHESESVQSLMTHLLAPPKLSVRLTPIQSVEFSESTTPEPSSDNLNFSMVSEDEIQAEEHIKHGEVDQAITIYERLKPDSARIFNIIGVLYSEKKADFDSALKYHKKALEIQEKNGDDITETLSYLGTVHQNRREFDLALTSHSRALIIRKATANIDPKLIAMNLVGIASAYCGQYKLSEALNYGQQALSINESIQSGNDSNVVINLSVLANIYHNMGDTVHALQSAIRAVKLLEKSASENSPALCSLLNNLGTIQASAGLYADARLNYIRALEISKKSLPEGHPRRISMENNIQRLAKLDERHKEKAKIQS